MSRTLDDIFAGPGAGEVSGQQERQSAGNREGVKPVSGTGNNAGVQVQTAGAAGVLQNSLPAGGESAVDLFLKNSPDKPLTEEEKRQQEKKRKREELMAAIGDGISALSNIYFTTRYAPNMYDGSRTRTERTRKRWDKLAAEQNASMRAFIAGLSDAWKEDQAKAERERAYNDAKAERDREYKFKVDVYNDEKKYRDAAEERAQAEAELAREMHDLDKRLKEGRIKEQRYNAEKARIEAVYAPLLAKERLKNTRQPSGGKGNSGAYKPFMLRYRDNHGRTIKNYDVNNPLQAAEMYNDGLRLGLIEEGINGKPKNWKEMRDRVINILGDDEKDVGGKRLKDDQRKKDRAINYKPEEIIDYVPGSIK